MRIGGIERLWCSCRMLMKNRSDKCVGSQRTAIVSVMVSLVWPREDVELVKFLCSQTRKEM